MSNQPSTFPNVLSLLGSPSISAPSVWVKTNTLSISSIALNWSHNPGIWVLWKAKSGKVYHIFKRLTCSNPNIINEVDEPKRLMRRTDASNQSSYHTARAEKEIIAQGA